MSDRVQALIADVQSRIVPRDKLPENLPNKWPGSEVLAGECTVEPIEEVDLHYADAPGLWSEQVEDKEILLGDVTHVAFPEDVDGGAVLRASKAPHGIDSVDSLAFYLPFHFYRGWGIYIRERGLLQLAAELDALATRRGTPLPPAVSLEFGYRLLWAHEYFHFRTEVACARAQQLHWPYIAIYPTYFGDAQGGLDEEALANAFALANAKRNGLTQQDKVAKSCARRWMKTLGPGYRDFPKFEGIAHAPAKDGLVDRMVGLGGFAHPLLTPGRLLYRDIGASHVPTYLVRERGAIVSLVRNFPNYGPLRVWAYTNDHKPPHVHTGTGPGDKKGHRFEWPSRNDMDGAPARIVKQFNDYADRFRSDISEKVGRIDWK
jgi:hypothetical protein